MARRRALYSFLMAAIYVVATLLSSLSLLICDHHHHHHHHHHHVCESHGEGCRCSTEVAISADCCDHHHPILGDNYTEYIELSQRGDSRVLQAISLMLMPALFDDATTDVALSLFLASRERSYRDFALPDSSHTSPRGLRAPPYLA